MTHHMTPDEFRRHGGAVIEWIARYMERIEDFPVRDGTRLLSSRARSKELRRLVL